MESKIKIGDYVSRWDKNEAFKVVGILSKDCILIKTGKKYHGSWKMCENLQDFNEYISVDMKEISEDAYYYICVVRLCTRVNINNKIKKIEI